MFPSLSLTFITIPLVFDVYVFDALACHVAPPSKLYAAFARPDWESVAFTVNVTFWFVHLSGFPVTFVIVGAVWSN